jgi:hypothetical protein
MLGTRGEHRGVPNVLGGGEPMTDALMSLVARLAETALGLRVEAGPGPTGPYAYDASNYTVPPRAVAFPRAADDVVAVLRACREAVVPGTARGGGASMTANAVGPGVVGLPINEPDPGYRHGGGHRVSRPESFSTSCAPRPLSTGSPSVPTRPRTAAARSAE